MDYLQIRELTEQEKEILKQGLKDEGLQDVMDRVDEDIKSILGYN